MALGADEVIALLDLQPHPEGGYFRETWRAQAGDDERAAGTSIYYLLKAGEVSHWHRVDAAEIWHWYAGGALELSISVDGQESRTETLGSALDQDQRPQIIVPKDAWQSARSLGAWTLVGCTVSPGFEFSGFEMAPDDWRPGQ